MSPSSTQGRATVARGFCMTELGCRPAGVRFTHSPAEGCFQATLGGRLLFYVTAAQLTQAQAITIDWRDLPTWERQQQPHHPRSSP